MLGATPHDAAAFSLALVKGWAGGSSDAQQAAVVEQERAVAAQLSAVRELLLALDIEAQAAADEVAEGDDGLRG